MWLSQSSIGRKVVMSVTGLALILFMTFHACMNVVAMFSGEAYNTICEMLGANWYAVAATAGLGALVVAHFVFAIMLTLQNRRARGNSRYAVTDRPEMVEWSSQNMFVLGVIICLGMLLHLGQFWLNMMYAEMFNDGQAVCYPHVSAHDGYELIKITFKNPINVVLYLIWFAALWFHMTHGMWSGLQTLGASGKTWFSRIKCISYVYSSIIMALFAIVVLFFGFGWGE